MDSLYGELARAGIVKRELKDAVTYPAAKHFDVKTFLLQHRDHGGPKSFWVGLSYFLPEGGAEMSASDIERVYIVLSGTLTLVTDEGEMKLKTMDTVYIPPGVKRKLTNKSKEPVTMLFVATYPEGER